jgi:hypothetical protein
MKLSAAEPEATDEVFPINVAAGRRYAETMMRLVAAERPQRNLSQPAPDSRCGSHEGPRRLGVRGLAAP